MKSEQAESPKPAHDCDSDFFEIFVNDPTVPFFYEPAIREWGIPQIVDDSFPVDWWQSCPIFPSHSCPWCGRMFAGSLRLQRMRRLADLGLQPGDQDVPAEFRSERWWRDEGFADPSFTPDYYLAAYLPGAVEDDIRPVMGTSGPNVQLRPELAHMLADKDVVAILEGLAVRDQDGYWVLQSGDTDALAGAVSSLIHRWPTSYFIFQGKYVYSGDKMMTVLADPKNLATLL